MNKVTIGIIALAVVIGGYFMFTGDKQEALRDQKVGIKEFSKIEKDEINFKSISSSELDTMLQNKDFLMIDVHTPEQEHIPETDYMISYDETDKIASIIPDKDTKVVLYCRSGNMTKRTAKALVEKGYTNIYELENGLNEWLAEERDVLPKGSVENL